MMVGNKPFAAEGAVVGYREPMCFVAHADECGERNARGDPAHNLIFLACGAFRDPYYRNTECHLFQNFFGNVHLSLAAVDKDTMRKWPVIVESPAQHFSHHACVVGLMNGADTEFPIFVFVRFVALEHHHGAHG